MTEKRRVTNDVAVLSPLRQPRAIISALLLLVQVLGLGHVALARHTLSENGAVIDVVPLATETHDEEEGHLCAGDVAIHADAPADCVVLAGFAAPSLVTPALALHRWPESIDSSLRSPSFVAVQLDVLSRAPKNSPPQG